MPADARWVSELRQRDYRPPLGPMAVGSTPVVGAVDRDGAAGEVLARLTGARSAFNAADNPGETEQLADLNADSMAGYNLF